MSQISNRFAERALTALQRQNPFALRLAQLASLAVRIDANLLRRLRLEVLPVADVGAEADLWFSDIVASRGSDVLVLDAHARSLLREGLAQEGGRTLDDVIRVTAAAHSQEPEVIQLEERVNGLALRRDPQAIEEIEHELQRALRAMTSLSPSAKEIARWALRAFPSFDPIVRKAKTGQMLGLVASLVLGDQRAATDPVSADVSVEELAWALPPSNERIPVGVELLADGVRFHLSPLQGQTFDVPRTDPLIVSLHWKSADLEIERTLAVKHGCVAHIDGAPEVVEITTLAGDRYALRRVPGTATSEAQTQSGVVPAEVMAECFELELLGGNGPSAVGFAVAPGFAVTVARPFRGVPLVAQLGPEGRQWRTIESDDPQAEILCLAPVGSVTGGLELTEEGGKPSGETERWAIGFTEGTPSPLPVTISIAQQGPDRVRAEVGAAQAGIHLVGAPIVRDGRVWGMVLRPSSAPSNSSPVVRSWVAATSAAIRGVVEAAAKKYGGEANRQAIGWRTLQVRQERDTLHFTLDDGMVLEQPINQGEVRALLGEAAITRPEASARWDKILQDVLRAMIPQDLIDRLGVERRDLLLVVDEQAATYPWELILAAVGGERALSPLIVRQLATPNRAPLVSPAGEGGALIIDAPGTASKSDLVSGDAQQVTEILKQLGLDVSLAGSERPALVISRLFEHPYRLLHVNAYVGEKGILLGAGHFLGSREFSQMKLIPPVVFLNCLPDSAEPRRLDDPVGRLAIELARAGASIVVAVESPSTGPQPATDFAGVFYESLIREGLTFGESLRRAKERTRRDPRGMLWGDHQFYGDPQFRFTPRNQVGGQDSSAHTDQAAASAPPKGSQQQAPAKKKPPAKKKAAKKKK
jgi:hypothetical protein